MIDVRDDWDDDELDAEDRDLPQALDLEDDEDDAADEAYCPACGAPVSELATQCPHCGAYMTPVLADSPGRGWRKRIGVVMVCLAGAALLVAVRACR